MSLNRPVIDLCCVSAMVSCTRLRALWGWIQHRSELPLWSSPGNALSFVFLCVRSPRVVSHGSSLFRAAPLAPTLTIRHLPFGFSNDELLVVPLVFVYLLNVLKSQIWVMRTNHRYRQVPPGAVGLIPATKSRLRFYLPLLAKRFLSSRRRRYFKRHWGASGVIGRFHNGRFNVII